MVSKAFIAPVASETEMSSAVGGVEAGVGLLWDTTPESRKRGELGGKSAKVIFGMAKI